MRTARPLASSTRGPIGPGRRCVCATCGHTGGVSLRKAWLRKAGSPVRGRAAVGLAILILVGLAMAPAATAQVSGFRASYESDGSRVIRTFRMWVPPEVETVRGAVFVWAGAGQDWRERAEWLPFQNAARALGFALIATTDNELGTTQAEVDVALDRIMDAAAQSSGHAELATAPLALAGFSQGGFRSAFATAVASGRVIGFVGHKGTQVVSLTDEGQEAPALMIAGASDGNFTPEFVRQAFQTWRNEGGLAAYAVDWGVGHNDLGNQGWELAWYWLSEVVRLRLPDAPASGEPGGAVELADVAIEDGWLGDKPRFRRDGTPFVTNPFFRIAPYAEFQGSPDAASWLPSAGAAFAYRAFTSTDEAERDDPPYQTPLVIRQPEALDSLAVDQPVTVEIDLRGFAEGSVQSVALYDGADSLGVASSTGDLWTFEWTPGTTGIKALVAIARDDAGVQRTTFRTVIVKSSLATASEGLPDARPLVALLPAYPNPFARRTTVAFELARARPVRVEVLDTLGRRVATLADAPFAPGRHALRLDAAGLANGAYVARLTSGDVVQTQPILLLR